MQLTPEVRDRLTCLSRKLMAEQSIDMAAVRLFLIETVNLIDRQLINEAAKNPIA